MAYGAKSAPKTSDTIPTMPNLSRGLTGFRTAILHQGGPAPAVGGVVKPFKPGGYTDSGSDLGNILHSKGETVITPSENPSPSDDKSWTFPDTVSGIREAVSKGANVLWANTVLYSAHALVQLRSELADKGVRMIGQSPAATQLVDDKAATNFWLAQHEGLQGSFPIAKLLRQSEALSWNGGWPAVMKPVRGRGSHGVAIVNDAEEMKAHSEKLFSESSAILMEEYCSGEEITITVLPPGVYDGVGEKTSHWALPVIRRVGHSKGIAPYSGLVPVSSNSHLVPSEEAKDPAYATVQRKCEIVAGLLGTFATMRIDCRRRAGNNGDFVLFDVNMKPNMTGPGRPGRENEIALTAMAAEGLGWDYGDFVINALRQAKLVEEVLAAPLPDIPTE